MATASATSSATPPNAMPKLDPIGGFPSLDKDNDIPAGATTNAPPPAGWTPYSRFSLLLLSFTNMLSKL
ncbi:hypothetical protein AAF712_007258 [Marasmius tenuissimus]|uniref:Uncharacterized protein n=1 Tax=Marasmius tenuissimus TaxID=585030 RepID=A0ABR2ZW06_9AGAR